MVKIKLGKKLNCLRCKHTWLPRKEEVIICPRCKSPYWNKSPRTPQKGGGFDV